jgi:2-polyprenyl-3-methyl-5-hydroxy-6-metoxy-1,4-benzoquinol methylase
MVELLPTIHWLLSERWRGETFTVLDVGTGTAAGANLLASLYAGDFFGPRLRVEGIELEPVYARYAPARFPLVDYRVGDVLDLPPSPAWDLVVCSAVVEHVADPVAFVRHLAAIARHWVVVQTPWREYDLIEGHANTIDDAFLAHVRAHAHFVLESPAFRDVHGARKECVIFLVAGEDPWPLPSAPPDRFVALRR